MSLGWIEDVVKDGKVALQSRDSEKSEVSAGEGEEPAIEAQGQDTVAPPQPSTMPNETAIAA